MAIFSNSKDPSIKKKITHFGAAGMSDFPTHKDIQRKKRFSEQVQELK